MSWDQGIQVREDLPAKFVLWADQQKDGAPLQYITWFGLGREVFLDYGEAGSLKLTFPVRDRTPSNKPASPVSSRSGKEAA